MKKTLIIHPEDKSTTFLEVIYKNIPEEQRTLVTGGLTINAVRDLIKSHDRVMMMGHGSPYGLFSCNKFVGQTRGYIIDHSTVPLLAEKEENIYIWCNADMFIKHHQLKGFYSGMFISEIDEAYYCGIPGMKQDDIDESNFGFSEILSKFVNEPKEVIYENVKKEYSAIAEINPVALYNNNRLFIS